MKQRVHVAETCARVATTELDAASYITGQVLTVDAGLSVAL